MNYVVTSIGQGPELEAHGGSTYCAVAALVLMGRFKEVGEDKSRGLKRWCISRQSGFLRSWIFFVSSAFSDIWCEGWIVVDLV